MNRRRRGDIFALACAIFCGLGNIPSKAALFNVTPEIFNFYMFFFAWIFSSLSLLKKETRADIKNVGARNLGLFFVLALLFAVAMLLNMTALKKIEPATASFLSRFEGVITVALAYMILKERLHPVEIVGGLIALGGVFVLKYRTNLVISQGATLMVMSSLFFAAAEIIIKKNISSIKTAALLFYRNLFLIPIFYLIIKIRRQDLMLPSGTDLLLIMAAALLLPVLGRATFQMALQRIDISRAALITQATPVFTALFAFVILHSLPTPVEWLGGGIIIAGVLLVNAFEIRFRPGPRGILPG